jgi:hypothetical protein
MRSAILQHAVDCSIMRSSNTSAAYMGQLFWHCQGILLLVNHVDDLITIKQKRAVLLEVVFFDRCVGDRS